MQAPTAPPGPPDSDPSGRTCPGCGATNGALAAFCWQCYRQFTASTPVVNRPGFGPGYAGGPGSSPPGAGYLPPGAGLRGAVVTPAETPSAPSRPSRAGATVGALLVALAVAAGVVFFLNRGSDVRLPEAFGGLTRIQNGQVEAAMEVYRSQADGQGFSTDMGLYGTADVPSAALIWVTGTGAPSADQAFSEFAGGFNQGLGTGSLDEGRKTTEIVDGVTYTCAPVVGTPTANLCMWEDDGVFWVLFDLSGGRMDAARTLSVAARDAVA